MNYGIEFSIVATSDSNRHDVLNKSLKAVKSATSISLSIGQPISISDIYKVINGIEGVADTSTVKIVNKTGASYSSTYVRIEDILSVDGLYVDTPLNVAMECKYPNSDIKGVVS